MGSIDNQIFDPVKQPRVHRDFCHDITEPPEQEGLVKRVVAVSLPILSLYRPFGKAINTGANTARLFYAGRDFELTLEKVGNVALSVAACSAYFFSSKVGVVVTTSHDVLLNLHAIATSEEKLLATVRLVNNVAYLALFINGSLQLQIASLAAQVLVNIGQSASDYSRGRYLEAGVNLVMGGVRAKQMSQYVELYNRRRATLEAIRNAYVGSMGEKWQFPSDHLPIGIEVDGEFKVLSWNVMNNEYMQWVRQHDSQRLNGSMLTQLDVPVEGKTPGFTRRDQLIVEMLSTMTGKDTGLIALQECGEPFLQELGKSLPEGWAIARSLEGPVVDQEVVLYNSKYVNYDPLRSETPLDAYPSEPGRQIAQAVFSKASDGKTLRMFNAHIPGNPYAPGPDEFARYVARSSSSDDVVIALGDCNFERDRMQEAFSKAGLLDERYPEQVLHTPWHTNVHPWMAKEDFPPMPLSSKGIDHALVLGAVSKQLKAEEVLNDERLKATIRALKEGV